MCGSHGGLWAFLIALLCMGCAPVHTVCGHTAAVLPAGEQRSRFAGGVTIIAREDPGEDAYVTGFPVVDMMWAKGLGGRTEYECGGMVFGSDSGVAGHLWVATRTQFLGQLEGHTPGQSRNRLPLDLSVEFGADLLGIPQAFGSASVFVGIEASVSSRGVAPYVAYRWHRGGFASVLGEEEAEGYFNIDMLFIGVEVGSDSDARLFEVFHGIPRSNTTPATSRTFATWGFNYITKF